MNNGIDEGLDMTNETDVAILKENLRNREKQQDKIDRTLETISKELAGIREQQIKDTLSIENKIQSSSDYLKIQIKGLEVRIVWYLLGLFCAINACSLF